VIIEGEGAVFGVNLRCPIVTNGSWDGNFGEDALLINIIIIVQRGVMEMVQCTLLKRIPAYSP